MINAYFIMIRDSNTKLGPGKQIQIQKLKLTNAKYDIVFYFEKINMLRDYHSRPTSGTGGFGSWVRMR